MIFHTHALFLFNTSTQKIDFTTTPLPSVAPMPSLPPPPRSFWILTHRWTTTIVFVGLAVKGVVVIVVVFIVIVIIVIIDIVVVIVD